MNLILLAPSDFIDAHVRLTGRRYQHIVEIIKPKSGDFLTVGIEGGKLGQGRITRIDGKALDMDIVLTQDPPAKLPVVLCVALMRPIVLKRVLQTATAMGVGEIHLFHSRQVEKSFWQSTALKDDAIRDELILGLEQAKDTILPTVHVHKRFKPFVEDVLPGLLQGREGIVADPSGEILKQGAGSGERGKIPTHGLSMLRAPCSVLIVGPEGGFIPYEIKTFQEAGCRVVSLGERILRVETAVVALLAKLG